MTMQELTNTAQHTSELYHELNALDRFEQDYRRKLEELQSLNLPRKELILLDGIDCSFMVWFYCKNLSYGESVMILQSELKNQRKLVRSLKKKSLWARSLEEVVEKLVDIVTFLHQEISEAFEDNGLVLVGTECDNKPERLGVAGLALHYANLINQIDNIASRPTSLPPNMRDQLYHGLPNSVKIALRSRCQTIDTKEELTIPQIKAEMEKTLQWLVPVATNTSKAHQGFGWVGEWANTCNEFGKKGDTHNNVIRLQTLHHADMHKTDHYILEMAAWLHRLISVVRHRDNGICRALPVRSPTRKGLNLQPVMMQRLPSLIDSPKAHSAQLSLEDRNLLEKVMNRKKLGPGISKSQEFGLAKKRGSKVWALSRSTGNSPSWQSEVPKSCVLDVMDGLDTIF
ncbi:hypothetical protein LOK49_LG05G03778 [Camellia lanceoleosa]|uniref:Uncharacterized protein n=1 Tax=Camellia lanceoleosa TaxID=1840588 RepID=A0ACC0HHZ1_9ERIC|nr:hypothetical protein LOK49_LG05G03778 [Camellia lanceoleosa]